MGYRTMKVIFLTKWTFGNDFIICVRDETELLINLEILNTTLKEI